METNKIIGVVKKEGEFQGKPYSNYLIYYFVDTTGKLNYYGSVSDFYKIKSSLIDLILSTRNITIDKIINKNISVEWNRYGQIESVKID